MQYTNIEFLRKQRKGSLSFVMYSVVEIYLFKKDISQFLRHSVFIAAAIVSFMLQMQVWSILDR